MNPSARLSAIALAAALPAIAFMASAAPSPAAAAEVVSLTQVGCQFLEPEGTDRGFKTSRKEDCDAVNAQSGAQRVGSAQIMHLKPGPYIFRVTNQNVPYELGFWLRSADYDGSNPLHKLTKTSVAGGGLIPGKTLDYEVTLKPGEYVYSCPLNPTPDYKVVVADR